MMAHRVILAPLDGSDLSQAVLKYIPAIVRPNDEILLLTVARYPEARRRTSTNFEPPIVVGASLATLAPTVPEYAEDLEQAMERVRDESRSYLEDQALFLRNEGLTVRTDVAFNNDPAAGVIEYAREMAPLFIAMATHGRGGLDHALHGSVCEHVIKSRVAPVLVVRP